MIRGIALPTVIVALAGCMQQEPATRGTAESAGGAASYGATGVPALAPSRRTAGGQSPQPRAIAAAGDYRAFLPDRTRTPGATFPVTQADICTPGYAHAVRNVTSAMKRDVYASYGVTHRDPGEYEMDHLIPLELGGSNSKRNLWPQSFRTQPWNASGKNVLENRLHAMVCQGAVPLDEAQRAIATDWVSAYLKYVHPYPPAPRAPRTPRTPPAGR